MPVYQGVIRDEGGAVYDVRAFGAVGDGATNDLAAIRAAVQAAVQDRVPLLFSPGTYVVDFTADATRKIEVTGDLVIRGAGRAFATVRALPSPPAFGYELFWVHPGADLEVSELTVEGPAFAPAVPFGSQPNTTAFHLAPPTANGVRQRAAFREVDVTGRFRNGIYSPGDAPGITGCDIFIETTRCGVQALAVSVGVYSNNPANKRFHAYDCLFEAGIADEGGRGNALYIHQSVSILVDGCVFQNNHRAAFKYAATAELAGAEYAVIQKCVFRDCTGTGIEPDRYGTVLVRDCVFGPGLNSGMQLFGGSVEVAGCLFQSTHAFSVSSSGGPAPRLNVSDCRFEVARSVSQSGWPGAVFRFVDCRFHATADATATLLATTIEEMTVEVLGCEFDLVNAQTAVNASTGRWRVEGCRFGGAYARGPVSLLKTTFPGLELHRNRFEQGSGASLYVYPSAALPRRVRGEDNAFAEGVPVVGGLPASVGAQDLLLRRGVRPGVLASAATLELPPNHDTFLVGGTATVTRVEVKNGSSATPATTAFAGVARLIARDAWALGTGGNIKPRSTAPRAADEVVTLVRDPETGSWYEA